MTRLKTALIAVLALAFVAAPATAQTSDQASLTASLTVEPSISITTVTDLTFPTSVNGAGLVANDQMGEWSVPADEGVDVSVTIDAPTALTDGSGNSVPLQYSGEEAIVNFCDTNGDGVGEMERLDPTTSDPDISSCIFVGGSSSAVKIGDPSVDALEADLSSSVPPGSYDATFTLTIAQN